MSAGGRRDLARLERLRFEFGPGPARERRALIARLARARLPRAADVLRLHECLLVARAYPDGAAVLAAAGRALLGFAKRRDLRQHRARLESSGIAGTDIAYRFFAPTARRLAERWPQRLTFDWDGDHDDRLAELLPLLALDAESPGLDEADLSLRAWLARMKGPREGDAAFFARRLAARARDSFVYERMFDGADPAMRLSAGPGGPTRTLARWPVARVHFQRGPLRRGRPDLAREVARPPLAVRELSRADGRRLAAMAAEAMVTRSRDLDAFAYADPGDARLVDCGEGLAFACLGVRPERRLLLESVYGFLTLKNGVPAGYVLVSALFGSAEIAYNVFDTFRGGEAGAIYGRVLATAAHLFGADSFVIVPYQLGGDGNDEGLESGAWWFYRKSGFEPRDRAVRRVMRAEEARMRRDPGHRSSRRTLLRLVGENVYWHAGPRRDDVMGLLALSNVGLAVTDFLARRFGGEGDRGAAACTREAAQRLGAGPGPGWTPAERHAFGRWAPLALVLPGLSRWSPRERRALAHVMRLKGSRRESDFVRAFDAHAKLRAAIARLAASRR